MVGWGLVSILVHPLNVSIPGAQELQQLSEPPEPFGPLTPLQWDEDQQLGNLKDLVRELCGLLLEEASPPEAPAKTANTNPVGEADLKSSLSFWAWLGKK